MLNEIINRLQYIDNLIREHNTGNAEDLAGVVGVSVRTVYKYLKMMKEFGAPISFDAFEKTYYYKTNGRLVCTFSFSIKSNRLKTSSIDKLNTAFIKMDNFVTMLNQTMSINYN